MIGCEFLIELGIETHSVFLFSPFVALCRIVIPDKYTDGNNITHMNVEMLCVHVCHSKGIADTFRMSIVGVCAGMCGYLCVNITPNPYGGSLERLA